MQNEFTTNRLYLQQLTLTDKAFIVELLNTPGWLKFIGDRQVRTTDAAEGYIGKILQNDNVKYWVVKLKDSDIAIGVITFIKRAYLQHHDIGFAFLPAYSGKGFAYEAAAAVLQHVAADKAHTHILASTIKDNKNSIALLEKLGLSFDKEIKVEEETLSLYGATADKVLIDHVVRSFFSIFTNRDGRQPQWELIHTLCLPETLIIKKTGLQQEVYDLDAFMEPRIKILSDGTLTGFEEKETAAETIISGNIAQRFSRYEKNGILNGTGYNGKGTKLFQCIKTAGGWKISAVVWEDEA
jgi:RimJ/RimL family protein N-acetyltransferase